MVGTAEPVGFPVVDRPGIVAGRVPPASGRFRSQRLRQADDDWAQPGWPAAEVAVLPIAVRLWRRPEGWWASR